MENNIDKEDGRWDQNSGTYETAGKYGREERAILREILIISLFFWGESGLERASGTEMDEQRKQNLAYQYLCHLEEAKVWVGK